MLDLHNNIVASKYQAPVLQKLYLPADLRTAILEANTLKAREAFYRALKKSSALELTMMKENIIFLMNQYTLIKVKENEFNLKSVFSLKAVHTELLKQLANCKDKKEKIALLHANQWLSFFYKDYAKRKILLRTNESQIFYYENDAAENLQRIMRDYALALESIDIQRPYSAVTAASIGILFLEILGVLLLSGTINGHWLALMIAQIPLLLLFVFSLRAPNSAEKESRQYENELKELTLPDALENAFCSAEAPRIQDAVKSLTDLINDLETSTSLVYIYTRDLTSKLNALKELNVNEYHKIHKVLNKLSVASKYVNGNQIVAEKFAAYIILAIASTSLVAISIGLAHTKDDFPGIAAYVVLGLIVAVALLFMFQPLNSPSMNKAFKQEKIGELKAIHQRLEAKLQQEKIDELKAIRDNLEQKLSEKPAPSSDQDACYEPQAGGLLFQYPQSSDPTHDGSKKNLYGSPVVEDNSFGHPQIAGAKYGCPKVNGFQ